LTHWDISVIMNHNVYTMVFEITSVHLYGEIHKKA